MTQNEPRKLEPGDPHYTAYVGPPEQYDFMGATQFRLLCTLGLRSHHKLLDFGCGSLRAGRFLIPYLNPGNYFGVEPNEWLVRDGIEMEIGADQVRIKSPTFSHDDSFDPNVFGIKFDFVVAQSIFSHTGRDLVRRGLQGIRKALKDDGIAAVTFVEGELFQETGWHYPGCVQFTRRDIAAFAAEASLFASRIPWFHPRQAWYLLARDASRLPSPEHRRFLRGAVLNDPELAQSVEQGESSKFVHAPPNKSAASKPEPRVNDLIDPKSDTAFIRFRCPPEVYRHVAMLGYEERNLAAWVASQVSGPGAQVELGCYLGGSTRAILAGLRLAGLLTDDGTPQLHSYDRFRATEGMSDTLEPFKIETGESFESAYRTLLGDEMRFVKVHAGDILNEVWDGTSIRYLYVDILWGWNINQHVFEQFYRSLVPGAWLVHQDFVHSCYPWLLTSMEWLVERGYFSYHAFGEFSTVSFRCLRALDDVPRDFDFANDIPLEEKLTFIRRAANRFVGYPRELVKLAEYGLLLKSGAPIEETIENARAAVAGSTEEFTRVHLGFIENIAECRRQ